MGRDINFLRQVAMKSGVPIVAGGGFYSQPFYPKEISTMSEDQIFRALIKQADDDVVGAFGEIGSWDEITADERKVFRAVGRAHVATNIPIFTHTGIPGKSALEQLDILEDAGVKPDRIVIGHLGNLVDPNLYVHKQICRRGAYIGFDRQGGNNDAQQVPMVLALIEAGYADHLMFSADASSGYAKTITVFLPKLKAAGASDEVLRHITVDNPRRFLAFVPKRPVRRDKRRLKSRVLFRFGVGSLETGVLDVTTDGHIPFVAGVLEHLILVIQLQRKRDCPRAHHYLRVLNPHFKVNRIVGGSCESLGDPHVFRGRIERRRTGNAGIGHVRLCR